MSGSTATDELSVYPPRGKLLLPILGCVVFVALAVSMVADPKPNSVIRSETLITVGGWLAIVLFGLGGLSLIARALSPRPALLLNREGIVNRTNLASVPYLKWDEITEIRESSVAGKKMLEFDVRDPESSFERCRTPLRKSLTRKNFQSGHGVSTISEMSIPGSVAELKALAQSHMKQSQH